MTGEDRETPAGMDLGDGWEDLDPGADAEERRRDLRTVIVWAVIVMILLIAGVLYLRLRKVRIPLNDYLTITAEGYETIGTASFIFDMDSFVDDYRDTIRYRGGRPNTTVGEYASAAEALIHNCVGGSLNRQSGLSNGDSVTFMWDCREQLAADDYHCSLVYSNIEEKVKGLKEPDSFDPFAGIKVTFGGTSPDGTADVEVISPGGIYDDLVYSADRKSGLANGDSVRVTVTSRDGGDVADMLLREHGKVPLTLEKTYRVEGLTAYVRSLSEISDITMQDMRAKAEQIFIDTEVPAWRTGAELLNREYLGSYLLVPVNSGTAEEEASKTGNIGGAILDGDVDSVPAGINRVIQNVLSVNEVTPANQSPISWPFGSGSGTEDEEEEEDHRENIIYLVYRVDVSIRGSEFSYYTYTAFSDLQLMPDGTVTVDMEAYNVPTGSSKLGVSSGDIVTVRKGFFLYHFSGFESLNALYMRCVHERRGSYYHETTIDS